MENEQTVTREELESVRNGMREIQKELNKKQLAIVQNATKDQISSTDKFQEELSDIVD